MENDLLKEMNVEKSIWMSKKLKYGIMAFRPWSLPTSLVPLFLAGIIIMLKGTGTIFSLNAIIGFIGTLIAHLLANGLNTYYDYLNKVDDKNSDDRGLIDKYIDIYTLSNVLKTMLSVMLCLFAVVINNSTQNTLSKILIISIPLIFMTIFYTFNIFSIKYLGRGFGEMAIFLCFGPLLMEGVSVILTGDYDFDIFIMSLPIGLSAVNILHANNVRDLKTDLNSGIKTLAYYLDEYNYSFYKYIYIISYLIPIVSSLFLNSEFYNFRRSLTILLNIPWTIYLLNCFKNNHFKELPQKTAQHNLLLSFILITTILPFDMFARLLLGMLFYLGGVNNILVYQLNYFLE